MTTRASLTLVTALIAAAVLTGCTEQSAGSPLPDDTTAATTQPDTTQPTSERPREINLDGKDPCALIPQSDWPKFEISSPGRPSEDPTFKSPQCYFSGDRAGDVTLVVTEGIEAWDGRTQNTEITNAEPIEGYATITITNDADRRSCIAAVDVDDGQYLMTTATPNPDDPALPERCDLAYQLAESAMKTLVAS